MNKIWLIIQREYGTRVRKKSFIVMTILGPLLFGGIFGLSIWMATKDSSEVRTVEVKDESGLFANAFENTETLHFTYTNLTLPEAKQQIEESGSFGLLYIPEIDIHQPQGITFYSESSAGIEMKSQLEKIIEEEIQNLKLEESEIDRETLASLKTSIDLEEVSIADGTEKQANTGLYIGIGYMASFLIYMFIFLYGAQIMRGVIEEKSSRILEVIISSVKPFQLMMGKIIGIAAVGLTQFLLWVVLTFSVYTLLMTLVGVDAETMAQMNQIQGAGGEFSQAQVQMAEVSGVLSSLNVVELLLSFVFYFLAGYLLYGSLFAAVGSAVDSDADSQQFMLPISLPLIAAIISLAAVLKDPNGSLAFWLSMVPLTSPVVMMMRIPFGVPTWEILLSMALLVGGFILTTWLAGRIYRIGILMHGTKVNYRVLGKWLMMKN
ncbi:ABC transporter permease [Nafulsella turpanensis]|uniref:ABC transporter permease n=1 Tax=Nafulsella turpanensis TaxID=1265690 RepID=UPI0003483071|nr:ABC transporter permease [Nafulsella turpanensis]